MSTVLLLSDDLHVASQVSAQLAALAPVKQVARLEMLAESIPKSEACLLLIDLAAAKLVTDLSFLSGLREEYPGIKVVAFAPHVQTARLEAAHEAGCDRVLTRGQMLREGAKWLADLLQDES